MKFSMLSPRTLARAGAHHPWRTLLAWIVVIAAIVGFSSVFSADEAEESTGFTNRPESVIADDLLTEHFGETGIASETIVFTSALFTVDHPSYRATVDATLANLAPWDADIANVANYYEMVATNAPEAEAFISEDRHALIMPVTFNGEWDEYDERAAEYIDIAQAATSADVQVYTVGDLSANETFGTIVEEDLAKEISVGLPMAGVILIVVFGALVAAFMPLLIGVLAIALATMLLGVLGNFIPIDDATMSVVSMIGLAVGIDYALFFLERFREERRNGALKLDAIERAGSTAGKAVLFSGATVILALFGLLLMPIDIFQSIGVSVLLVVVIAVAAALTLLPAMLRLVGDFANFPRLGIMKKLRTQDRTGIAQFPVTRRSGFWGKVAQLVMRRPGFALVTTAGLLVLCALPVFTMELGQPSNDTLPDTDFKRGYTVIAQQFDAGIDAPISIVVDGDANDPRITGGVDAFVAALQGDERFGAVTPTVAADGQATRIDAVTHVDVYSNDANDIIADLRDDIIPATFGETANDVFVGGATADTVDFNNTMTDRLPQVFAFVLGLSFVLLMLAFRSIVVPLKAIVLNLLSVAASYGMIIAIFQHGWGADLFGFTQVESITTWVPVMLFCILFGLSMDYHVFLISRIREHYDLSHNNEESVAVGLQSTGRIITGAALIMVAVFGSFAGGRLADMQQMGFGLGFAVLIDATLIRTILVPASMKLLGDANWYMPRLLRWLPDLRVEGDVEPGRISRQPSGSVAD